MNPVLGAITGDPWAIQPHVLSAIWAIATRQQEGKAGVDFLAREVAFLSAVGQTRKLEGARTAVVSGGVAIIPVLGPIFPRANLLTEISGATSASVLNSDIRAALAAKDVRAILLYVDSPGGHVTGIANVYDTIRGAKGQKPIIAHIAGTAASAAYWIASAAQEIRAERTALVGSIGVAVAMPKQVAPNANGEMVLEIVSSSAPNKRPDPEAEEGRAEILKTLDAIEGQFIGDVAAGRGVSAAHVKAEFGKGGMVPKLSDAIAARMVDRVSTYEQSLNAAQRAALRQRTEALR